MKSALTSILAEPAIIGPPFSTFSLSLFFPIFFSLGVQNAGNLDIALVVCLFFGQLLLRVAK
jgi:hypothetical protein